MIKITRVLFLLTVTFAHSKVEKEIPCSELVSEKIENPSLFLSLSSHLTSILKPSKLVEYKKIKSLIKTSLSLMKLRGLLYIC